MNAIASRLLKSWPIVALGASAAMLSAAHYFESQGYAPCTLCLKQREVYWVAIAVAASALAIGRTQAGPRSAKMFDALLAVIFLIGAGVAFFHAGVELKWWPGPTTCASTGGGASTAAMQALAGGAKVRPPACDEAVWFFLGMSMAAWNGAISLGLAGLGALATLQRGKA